MKNYRGSADRLTLIAPSGGVVSGNLYVIGGLAVFAEATAAEGELFSAVRRGEFTYPKHTETVVAGDPCYLDVAGGIVRKASASGRYLIGAFTAAAASGDDGTFVMDGVRVVAV